MDCACPPCCDSYVIDRVLTGHRACRCPAPGRTPPACVGPIIEACACGRTFTAAQWSALALVRHGYQDVSFDQTECRPPCTAQYAVGEANHAPDCESRSYTLEIRNCPCKSTLARKRPSGWRP